MSVETQESTLLNIICIFSVGKFLVTPALQSAHLVKIYVKGMVCVNFTLYHR
jgi:hypothetical protein